MSLVCAQARSSGPWGLPGKRRRCSAQLLVLHHGFISSLHLTRVADGCPAEGRSAQRTGAIELQRRPPHGINSAQMLMS